MNIQVREVKEWRETDSKVVGGSMAMLDDSRAAGPADASFALRLPEYSEQRGTRKHCWGERAEECESAVQKNARRARRHPG